MVLWAPVPAALSTVPVPSAAGLTALLAALLLSGAEGCKAAAAAAAATAAAIAGLARVSPVISLYSDDSWGEAALVAAVTGGGWSLTYTLSGWLLAGRAPTPASTSSSVAGTNGTDLTCVVFVETPVRSPT